MRARNIKPGFFKNEKLVELDFETRLLFIGLWTMADREGRLEDRPKKIKMELFPADNVDVNKKVQCLHDAGFVLRYVIDNKRYIQVNKFLKHQTPHIKEAPSIIPAPDEHQTSTVLAPPDSLIPDSLIPDSGLSDSSSPVYLIPLEQKAMMTINDFRFLFTDNFKTSMPPGCNQLASELCQHYPRDAIIEAFRIAAEQGKNSVAYVKGVLMGNGKAKAASCEYDPSRDYEPGSYFDLLKQEELRCSTTR